MTRLLVLIFAALCVQATISTNVWPSSNQAYDDIEDLYTITDGTGSPGFTSEIIPCSSPPRANLGSGRQAAAEWIRLAYHDMATHDVSDGSGGIDASIQYELGRPQNVGDGQVATLRVMGQHIGGYRSISDLISLGVVLATKSCGGPSIPLRVGRVDATAVGPATVPEPQQDLASHTAAFARHGFNATEMIALVACGHSFGGVHQVDFPDIVDADVVGEGNSEGVQHFRKSPTYDPFGNQIAKEWIDGTTTNPLVTSFNETMHADQRIFGSDGNHTMKAFARDARLFREQCGLLMERMINTVPSTVSLSDVIVPYPVKPEALRLTIISNSTMILRGQLRLFDSDPDKFTNTTAVTAKITWKDRHGKSCRGCSISAFNDQGESSSLWGSVTMLGINATISVAQGISSFVVEYTTGDRSHTVSENNGGGGFPMQDMVIWDSARTCGVPIESLTVVVAIRNDAGRITNPYLLQTYLGDVEVDGVLGSSQLRRTVPLTVAHNLVAVSPAYTMYTATVAGQTATFFVGATIGGKTFSQWADALLLLQGLPSCST